MKVSTWNIPYSFRSTSSHNDAWEYYLNEISADYYLFQEAHPPEWVAGEYNLVWGEIGETRAWGSGIVSKDHILHEIEVDTEFRGAVIVAESGFSSEREFTLVSLYGLLEDIGGDAYSIPNLHRMLSDLTGLLTYGKGNVILGGDLNASEQIDEVYNLGTHRIFFERLEAFGLTNCFGPFYGDYVQTHRHSRSDRKWQNDYFFISNELADSLRSCEVIDNEDVRQHSDHNPVLIALDLGGRPTQLDDYEGKGDD